MSEADLGAGCRIHYRRIVGADSRPCLVFLHDGLGCAAAWKNFPDALCADTGCGGLVYDRQGHGRSSPLCATRGIHYLHEYALRELPGLLAYAIPRRPYLLIGHSDGGSIALLHGARRDPSLMGIVTEAAHVFVEEQTLAGVRTARDEWLAGKLDGLRLYHAEKAAAVFEGWANTWLDPAFRHWNIEYALPSIQCPLLVLQGHDDPYGSSAQVLAIANATAGPARTEVLKGCAHNPHREAPARVRALMTRFIEKTIEDNT